MAVMAMARIQKVIGLGGVGLSCVMGAVLAEAGRIVAIDRVPAKLETARGLGATIDYLESVGMDRIAAHEHELITCATEAFRELKDVRIVGTAREKAGVLSFTVKGVHPHDVGTILNEDGVAVRTGHHCAQPVMQRFGIPATARASFYLYNTRSEVNALVAGIHKVRKIFG